jgi:hypothetical protein
VRELMESSEGGLVVVLECGAKIRVSRRRRAAFMAAVRQFGAVRTAKG